MQKMSMKIIPSSATSKPYLIAGVVPKDEIGSGTTPTWLKWVSLLFLVVMITLWYTLIQPEIEKCNNSVGAIAGAQVGFYIVIFLLYFFVIGPLCGVTFSFLGNLF